MKKYFKFALPLFIFPIIAFGKGELQKIIDDAAARGGKLVKISGFYTLSEPLKLDERHSGMTIDGGGETVVCCGEKIAGWRFEGGFWRAKAKIGKADSMFVNGARANPSAGGFARMYNVCVADPTNSFFARSRDLELLDGLSPDEIKNAYIEECDVWHNSRLPIVSVEKIGGGKTSLVKLAGDNRTPFFLFEKFPHYRVCNTRKGLRKEGEFYFDMASREILYLPRKGENMQTAEAFIPALPLALEIAGKSPKSRAENIAVKGVDFFCGSVEPFTLGMQAAKPAKGFVRIYNARAVSFSGNKIRCADSCALDIGKAADGISVEGNEISDIGCGGVKIGEEPACIKSPEEDTFGVRVSDNIIRAYGRYNKSAAGILALDARDVEIDHNTIFDGFYSAISCGWTWGYAPTRTRGNKITNNRIFDIGQGYLCDMAGIYTLGSHKDSVISGNDISGVRRQRYGGWGIYNDEGSGDFLVEKNYVHGVQDDGYFQHYGIRNTVRNNVFENNGIGETQIGLLRRGKDYPDQLFFERNIVSYAGGSTVLKHGLVGRGNGKFDRNIYWAGGSQPDFGGANFAQWQEKFGQDKNSIVEDPRLKDGVPENAAAARKIGFEAFSTKGAGARGKMKERLKEILGAYKTPETFSIPLLPDWPREYEMDLSRSPIGGRPILFGAISQYIGSANNGYDVCVLREGNSRYLRFFDSKLPDKTHYPTLNIHWVHFPKGERCVLKFEARLYSFSTFFVECRGDTGHSGPIMRFKNGKPIVGGKAVDAPFGKWLECSIEFAIDGSRNFKVEIRDGKKILAQGSQTYAAKPMSRAQAIVVAQTSNAEGAYFDIRGLSLKSAE